MLNQNIPFKMKYLLFLVCYSCIVQISVSQVDECIIGNGSLRLDYSFIDTDVPGPFANLTRSTIAELELPAQDPMIVKSTRYDDYTELSIVDLNLDEANEDYLKSWTIENDIATTSLELQVTCNGTPMPNKGILIVLTVRDKNTHNPELSSSNHFKVPMPLVSGVDISLLGVSITATDLDFSNNRIDLEFNPPDLEASVKEKHGKQYTFNIKLTKTLEESATYEVIATDSGTVPLKSKPVKLELIRDENNSVPDTPSTANSSYSIGPELHSEVVIEVNTKAPDKLYAEVTSFKENFNVITNQTKKEVTVALLSFPDTPEPYIVTDLKIKTENEMHVALLLELPRGPKFEKGIYTTEYSQSSPVTIITGIRVISDFAPTVEVTGDYKTTFEARKTGDSWQVDVKGDLPSNILEYGGELGIILTAKDSNDKTDEAVVLLSFAQPDDAPQFSKIAYSAEYSNDENGSVVLTEPIKLKVPITDAQVDIKGDYETNFLAKASSAANEWTIEVHQKLSDDLLSSTHNIIINLLASDPATMKTGEAVVSISLPAIDGSPKFSKMGYAADYVVGVDGADSVKMGEGDVITVTSDAADTIKMEITTKEYESNFKIEYTEGDTWVLGVKKGLSEDVLNHNQVLVITLTATANSKTSNSYVTINLPSVVEPTDPKFSEDYYTGHYLVGSEELELDGQMAITYDYLNDISVTPNDYQDYFKIVPEDDEWKVKVTNPLPNDILDTARDIGLILTASDISRGKSAICYLVVKLPNNEGPKFSEILYSGNYSNEGNGSVSLSNKIELKNTDTTNIAVAVIGDYKTNFLAKPSSAANEWTIEVDQKLGDELQSSTHNIIINLEASDSATMKTGEAVVSISLPDIDVSPKFSKLDYAAEYVVGVDGVATVKMADGDDIMVTSEAAGTINVEIATEDYESNFKIDNIEGNTWVIGVNKNLSEDVLNNNQVLFIILTATANSKTSNAYVTINLPSVVETNDPKFSEDYYTGHYLVGSEELELDEKMVIKYDHLNDISVTPNDYQDYFGIVPVDDEWKVKITNRLPEDILDTARDIALILTASDTSRGKSAICYLAVKLPNNESPKFSERLYSGNYSNEGDGSVSLSSRIELTNTDTANIVVAVIGDYETNFFAKPNSAANEWTIEVLQKLNDELLSSTHNIIINLEASDPATMKTGEALVSISLPESDGSPKFSKLGYAAEYVFDVDGVASVKMADGDDISVTSDAPGAINVEIATKEYKSNFKIDHTEGNTWVIGVSKNISEDVLKNNQNLVIILTATANSRSSNAFVTINLPSVQELNDPKFSEDYYTGYYLVGSEELKLEDKMVIKYEYLEDISVTSNDYQDYIKIVPEDDEWKVKITNPLPDDILDTARDIALILTALDTSRGKSAICYLAVKLPNNESPKFSEILYSGNYSKEGDGSVSLSSKIELTNTDTTHIVITVIDDYSSNFEVNEDGELNVKKKLETEVLNSVDKILVNLQATNDVSLKYGKAAVSLQLPNRGAAPQFSSVHYKGSYNLSGTQPSVDMERDIEITSTGTLRVYVDTEYQKYFELVKAENNKWIVDVQDPLTDEIMKRDDILLLTLTAADTTNTKSSSALLSIRMPENVDSINPKFSKEYYVGYYELNNENWEVKLDEPIDITYENLGNIEVRLNDYNDNFEVIRSSEDNKWIVKVTEPLLDDVMKEAKDLLLQMTAVDTTAEFKASIVFLIIKLPPVSETPVFSQGLYKGVYKEDGDANVVLDNPLSIININHHNIEISFGDYDQYFKPVVTGSNMWQIKVDNKLPSDILVSMDKLLIGVTAKDGTTGKSGASFLAIDLPQHDDDNPIPEFDQTLYYGYYRISNTEATVVLNQPIIISGASPKDLKVTFSSYKDNFDITYNSNDEDWVITVGAPLGDDILNDSEQLAITLVAQETVNHKESTAALILILPSAPNEENPEFTESVYIGKYDKDNEKVDLESSISIKNNEDDSVEVTLLSGGDNFSMGKTGTNIWSIRVDKKLSQDIIDNYEQLLLTLTATNTKTFKRGEGNVLIKLTDDITSDAPQFSQVRYLGEYIVIDDRNAKVVLTTSITVFNANNNDIVIDVTDEYKDNFKVELVNERWQIRVIKNLDLYSMDSYLQRIISLTATVKSTSKKFEAVLVITLPKVTRDIQFDEDLYIADYILDDGKAEVNLSKHITVKNVDPELVKVNLTDCENYFILERDDDSWEVGVKKKLDKDLFSKKILIIPIRAKYQGNEAASTIIMKLPNTGDTHTDTDCEYTGYIVGISVVSVLFVAALSGIGLLYYFRVRNPSYIDMSDDVKRSPIFNKTKSKFSLGKSESLAERRPTSFIPATAPPPEIITDVTDSSEAPDLSNAKSVAFNDFVEEKAIEEVKEDDNASVSLNGNSDEESASDSEPEKRVTVTLEDVAKELETTNI